MTYLQDTKNRFKRRDLRKGDERGFTIIELLVVMIVIGVLAAIAIPMYLNQQKIARDTQSVADARNAMATAYTVQLSHPDSFSYSFTDNNGVELWGATDEYWDVFVAAHYNDGKPILGSLSPITVSGNSTVIIENIDINGNVVAVPESHTGADLGIVGFKVTAWHPKGKVHTGYGNGATYNSIGEN